MPQPNGESGMRIYGGAPHLDQVVGLDDWIVVDDDDDEVAHLRCHPTGWQDYTLIDG